MSAAARVGAPGWTDDEIDREVARRLHAVAELRPFTVAIGRVEEKHGARPRCPREGALWFARVAFDQDTPPTLRLVFLDVLRDLVKLARHEARAELLGSGRPDATGEAWRPC